MFFQELVKQLDSDAIQVIFTDISRSLMMLTIVLCVYIYATVFQIRKMNNYMNNLFIVWTFFVPFYITFIIMSLPYINPDGQRPFFYLGLATSINALFVSIKILLVFVYRMYRKGLTHENQALTQIAEPS